MKKKPTYQLFPIKNFYILVIIVLGIIIFFTRQQSIDYKDQVSQLISRIQDTQSQIETAKQEKNKYIIVAKLTNNKGIKLYTPKKLLEFRYRLPSDTRMTYYQRLPGAFAGQSGYAIVSNTNRMPVQRILYYTKVLQHIFGKNQIALINIKPATWAISCK